LAAASQQDRSEVTENRPQPNDESQARERILRLIRQMARAVIGELKADSASASRPTTTMQNHSESSRSTKVDQNDEPETNAEHGPPPASHEPGSDGDPLTIPR
jgi:hypothetical protein